MIAVVGSINMDMVVNVNSIPRIGETVLGDDALRVPGGKGANQAVTIAKLGGEVALIGAVGTDPTGEFLLDSIKKSGVDTHHVVKKSKALTGMAFVIVDNKGDNIITVTPGANFHLAPMDIENNCSVLQSAKIVLVQMEIPIQTVQKTLEVAKAYGKTTLLNPAPATQFDHRLYSLVDILTPNKTELEFLSGMKADTNDEILKACETLYAKGISTIIVILGSKGSFLFDSNGGEFIPAVHVTAVDSTAAGDAYNAALAFYLAQPNKERSIREAAQFASLAGALTVTKVGAQPSLPTAKELEAFWKSL